MADHFLRRENGFNRKRFSDERKRDKRGCEEITEQWEEKGGLSIVSEFKTQEGWIVRREAVK
jgi:hypothetical protein